MLRRGVFRPRPPPQILHPASLPSPSPPPQTFPRRYVPRGLVPSSWQEASASGAVYLRSTPYHRTVQSIAERVGAMYPGDFQEGAVRVHVAERGRETLFLDADNCPTLARLLAAGRARLDSGDLTAGSRLSLCALTGDPETLGTTGYTLATLDTAIRAALALPATPSNTPLNWVRIHDVLHSLEHDGTPMPAGLDLNMKEALAIAAVRTVASALEGGAGSEAEVEDVARLGASRMLQELLLRIDAAAFAHALRVSEETGVQLPAWANQQAATDLALALDTQAYFPRGEAPAHATPAAPALCLYSAHDTTLIPLLVALGAWDGKWPRYGSTIAVELVAEEVGGGSSGGDGGEGGGDAASPAAAAPPPPPPRHPARPRLQMLLQARMPCRGSVTPWRRLLQVTRRRAQRVLVTPQLPCQWMLPQLRAWRRCWSATWLWWARWLSLRIA